MSRLLSRVCLFLSLLIASGFLTSKPAHALIVSCSVTSSSINFGPVNVISSTATTATGTIGYTCTNLLALLPANFSVCAILGTPSSPGTTSQPVMLGATSGSSLKFNLYTNMPGGTIWTGTTSISAPVSIPAGLGMSVSGSLSFYGSVPGSQTSAAETYAASFTNSTLSSLNGTACTGMSLLYLPQSFTLSVAAMVTKTCAVTASPMLNFGSVAFNATSITGSNTIGVTCPTGTPFYVGLSPSNANLTGAGSMSSTTGGTDKVPYQLRSVSVSGPVWGNTATAVSVGNGVAGTGIGSQQTLTVYGSVPNANFTPGSYADTVTVDVNY